VCFLNGTHIKEQKSVDHALVEKFVDLGLLPSIIKQISVGCYIQNIKIFHCLRKLFQNKKCRQELTRVPNALDIMWKQVMRWDEVLEVYEKKKSFLYYERLVLADGIVLITPIQIIFPLMKHFIVRKIEGFHSRKIPLNVLLL
jgi:hypothetical protein